MAASSANGAQGQGGQGYAMLQSLAGANFRAPQQAIQAVFETILPLARDNDAEGVKRVLRLGCPPTFGNRYGQTALHIGSIWGSAEAVQVLLEARANPSIRNQIRGQTPLHAAALGRGPLERRAECAKILMQFGADPHCPDNGGQTPIDIADGEVLRQAMGAAPLLLHEAVRSQSMDDLRSALATVLGSTEPGGLTLEHTAAGSGETALHEAATSAWHAGVLELLRARADLSARDDRLRTPLHSAVQRSGPAAWACVKDLLAARADPHALDMDMDYDPRFISKTFTEPADPEQHQTPLHIAAASGNLAGAALLLHSKANPNARDAARDTPLHLCLALREGVAELSEGSSVQVADTATDPKLRAALGVVCGRGAQDAASGAATWRVQLAAPPGQPQGAAATEVCLPAAALQPAAEAMVDLLLRARADPNLGSRGIGETRTVLHQAVMQGDVPLAARVVAARVDLNRQDEKLGLSALHLAARARNQGLVALLLKAQASTELRSSSGHTALELAEKNASPGALLALLKDPSAAAAEVPDEADDVPMRPARSDSDDDQARVESLSAEQRAMMFLD